MGARRRFGMSIGQLIGKAQVQAQSGNDSGFSGVGKKIRRVKGKIATPQTSSSNQNKETLG